MQVVLQQLVDAIGYPDALNVCRRWGGRTLAVPVKVARDDPLALTLGLDPAQRLVLIFGGQSLQVPREVDALITERDRKIASLCGSGGKSRSEVALLFGLTRQGVAAVLRKVERQQSRNADSITV